MGIKATADIPSSHLMALIKRYKSLPSFTMTTAVGNMSVTTTLRIVIPVP